MSPSTTHRPTPPTPCPRSRTERRGTAMHLRHGTFSYLPDFSDADIAAQVRYALLNNWPVSIEYTDDPHPRNVYWEMWGLPLFDLDEPDGVLAEINACRATFPRHYIRFNAYDASYGRQTTALSFL